MSGTRRVTVTVLNVTIWGRATTSLNGGLRVSGGSRPSDRVCTRLPRASSPLPGSHGNKTHSGWSISQSFNWQKNDFVSYSFMRRKRKREGKKPRILTVFFWAWRSVGLYDIALWNPWWLYPCHRVMTILPQNNFYAAVREGPLTRFLPFYGLSLCPTRESTRFYSSNREGTTLAPPLSHLLTRKNVIFTV